MASPQEVNRQVALALGMAIIPLDKADCHTHAEGVKYLYAAGERLWHTPMDYIDEYEGGDPWSPATDPADALACLEELALQRRRSVKFWFDIGKRTGRLTYVCIIEGVAAVDGDTICEAACQAILAAQGDAK